MMGDVQHDEVEELLGAYALDAVDADEAAAVEAHLASCPRCRAELDAHREVAAHLAQGGAPAPDLLWDRIADAIGGETPPPLRLVVDERRSAPPTRRRLARLPMASAAAVLVVALVAAGFLLGRSGDDEPAGGDLRELAMAAIESPDARIAALVDPDGTTQARAVVLPDGAGYLVPTSLPRLDAGIYQLWGTDGDTVVSLGTMGASPEVVAFHADPRHTTLMLTAEDAPVERSSNPAVVVGELA